jgi:hypothetical protein
MIKLSHFVLPLLILFFGFAFGLTTEAQEKKAKPKSKPVITKALPQASGSYDDVTSQDSVYSILRVLRATKDVGANVNCEDCALYSTQGLKNVTACQAAYLRMFEKDVVNMNMTFGYMDDLSTGQKVIDKYAAQEMREAIQKGCNDRNHSACEFVPECDSEPVYPIDAKCDPDAFLKKIKGPDGYMKKVRVRVVNSSYSDTKSGNFNTSTGRPTQGQVDQTQVAEGAFFGSMGKSDVSIYAGHARYTCSPSFGPEFVNSNGTVNKARAQGDRSGLQRLKSALSNANPPPKLMAILGCDCDNLAGEEIRSSSPKTGVIMPTTVLSPDQATGIAYTTLDSILGMRCEDQFNSAIEKSFIANTAPEDQALSRRKNEVKQFYDSKQVPPLRLPPGPEQQEQTPYSQPPGLQPNQPAPEEEEGQGTENPFLRAKKNYTPSGAPNGANQRVPLTPPMRYDQMGR